MAYTWTFDRSFLIFLLIAFISTAAAVRMRSLIPMPFIYGVIFILGFALDILPQDMLLSANMIYVGTIAYNVLVVHSGTMIDLKLLCRRRKETLLCLVSVALLVAADLLILTPVLGMQIAFISPGCVVGGGASCAIASRLLSSDYPDLAVFPWLIFMLQGLFSVPVVSWALRKESLRLLSDQRSAQPADISRTTTLCSRIPGEYKSTAYFLGILMIITVANNLLHETILEGLNINSYITALCLGFIFANLGIMDRAPLFKSDSYGLLILGLMGLMANTLAGSSWELIISYIPALLLVMMLSSLVLIVCAVVGSRISGISPYRAIALLMNCVMGFPVNDMLVSDASKLGKTENERIYLKNQLGPALGISTALITNALSTIVVGIMAMFI